MRVVVPPPSEPAEPSTGAVRESLRRLLASEQFRDSPMLCRLLAYIVEETVAGNGRELKEYNLGISVFNRGREFDPRTDSIVRVQVGVLRKKLALYYAAAGQADEVRIAVPRGHYSAEFGARLEGAPEAPPPQPAPPATRPWWLWLAAGLLLGLLPAAWLATRRAAAPPESASRVSPWRDHPLWSGFFDPDVPTQLVVGAPMFLQFGGVYVRDSNINTPEEAAHDARLRRLRDSFQDQMRPEEIYTGLGEAAGLYTLGRFFSAGGKDLPLVRSRLARWQDVAHSNLILLSSFRFRTLSQQLGLPHEFEFDAPHSRIRNLRPHPGEREVYASSLRNGELEYDYALVSVWPSPQSGRRIMAIGGAFTWGTQGAADYVTDPPNLRELARRLADGRPEEPELGLQILLKILVKDRQPIATSYVTHHWVPLSRKP